MAQSTKHPHSKKKAAQKQDSEEDKIPYSPYKEMFLQFQQELDSKYDKHERLVKISRDCTIRSKRVIFALHRISGNEASRESILAEAREKIKNEISCLLQAIAKEIHGDDPRKHRKAFTPGLQEFIEALAFLKFLTNGCLITMEEVSAYLTFKVPQRDLPQPSPEQSTVTGETSLAEEIDGLKIDTASSEVDDSKNTSCVPKEVVMTIPLDVIDYILGVADVTGELMRLCINSVGLGDRDFPFNVVAFIRAMYCGFLLLSPGPKEKGTKTSVMKSSLKKVERVCYTLKIRGSEIPEHMLMYVISKQENGQDNNTDDF